MFGRWKPGVTQVQKYKVPLYGPYTFIKKLDAGMVLLEASDGYRFIGTLNRFEKIKKTRGSK